jgi:pimeloyl-ACP methyl ester carboxylesterase
MLASREACATLNKMNKGRKKMCFHKNSGGSGRVLWIVFLALLCVGALWFYFETKKRAVIVKPQVTVNQPLRTTEAAYPSPLPLSPQPPAEKTPEKTEKPRKGSVKQDSFIIENINLHRNKDAVVRYAIPLDENGKPGPNAHNIVFYSPYITERNFFKRDFHRWFPEAAGFTIFSIEINSTTEDIGVRGKYYCFPETGWHDIVFKAQEKIIRDFALKERKLLVIAESAGGSLAQQMGVHSPDKIDAIAMVGGRFFDPPNEKSKIAWLALNTWGCPGVDANREFEASAKKIGMQVLRAETPPIWELKGKQYFHHGPSELTLGMIQNFISECAKLRDANGGIMPPPEKWEYLSLNSYGEKVFLPSKEFEEAWNSIPHKGIRMALDYQNQKKSYLILKPAKKGVPDRIVFFIHDPELYGSTFLIDNTYRIVSAGAVCISVVMDTDNYSSSLEFISKNLELALKDYKDIPVYIVGVGSGGMLAAVAALKNGDTRIKKITTFNSPCYDWAGDEFSIPGARKKDGNIPLKMFFDGKDFNLPEENSKIDVEFISADGEFFGEKWFPLLDSAVK